MLQEAIKSAKRLLEVISKDDFRATEVELEVLKKYLETALAEINSY